MIKALLGDLETWLGYYPGAMISLSSPRDTGGEHDLEILLTGDAPKSNMWDVAVGDLDPGDGGLDILGVDETGSLYRVRKRGGVWEGETLWREKGTGPLYAVVTVEVVSGSAGEEVLVAGEKGELYLVALEVGGR